MSFVSPYYAVSGNNAEHPDGESGFWPRPAQGGQFVASTIITGSQSSLAVPVQAVMMQAQQPFVYKVVP